MFSKTYITKSANQTRNLGQKLALEILARGKNNSLAKDIVFRKKSKSPTADLTLGERWGRGSSNLRALKKQALVLAMQGDLGGGKTTFTQGFARGLGIKDNISSPTFVIIKKFHIPYSRFQVFYHIDAYRLDSYKDLLELGIQDMISGSRNIIIIE